MPKHPHHSHRISLTPGKSGILTVLLCAYGEADVQPSLLPVHFIIPATYCQVVFSYFLRFKFQFIALSCEMQNSKCKVQNCGVSFGNNLKISAKPIPSFCILHSAFCIGQRPQKKHPHGCKAVTNRESPKVFRKPPACQARSCLRGHPRQIPI